MRRLAVGLALGASVSLLAQPASTNLWVGVLTYQGASSGEVTSNARGEFEPVGSLVDGTWHFELEGDRDLARLGATYGRTPPQWLPVGRELPRTWRAWLTDGRTASFELKGPFRPTGVWDTERIAVDVMVPTKASRSSEDLAGVAIAGDASVHPFAPFSDHHDHDERAEAPPEQVLRAMLNLEVRELASALPRTIPEEEARRMLADVTLQRLSETPFTGTLTRTVTMPDGTRQTAFEGWKSFAPHSCGLHSGGAWVDAPRREPVVLGAWTYLDCNEVHVDHIPLAVITRGGRACWLFKYQYEDGARLVLRPPGKVDYLKDDSACDIR